ncbi:hypothetical protein ACHHYP_20507 [Achlya hypogyna]|uniref:Uncharacterized protein n=1 Tax=Achlya hypogyna TaxID=1202772 RepID=A0A1V9YKA9_ACHHY|nr:hypothetical protein ACHHYP_20507 [Achlya hypogyna]
MGPFKAKLRCLWMKDTTVYTTAKEKRMATILRAIEAWEDITPDCIPIVVVVCEVAERCPHFLYYDGTFAADCIDVQALRADLDSVDGLAVAREVVSAFVAAGVLADADAVDRGDNVRLGFLLKQYTAQSRPTLERQDLYGRPESPARPATASTRASAATKAAGP